MANQNDVNCPTPSAVEEKRIQQVQTVLMKYRRTGEFLHNAMKASTAIGSFKANTVPDMDFLCSRAVLIAASLSLSEKGAYVGIMVGREEYPCAVERKYKCANLVTILDHRGRPLLPQWSGLLSNLLNCPMNRIQFDREVVVPHLINACEMYYCISQLTDASVSNSNADNGIKSTGQVKPFTSRLVIAFDGKVPKRERLHCMRIIQEVADAMVVDIKDCGAMTIPLLSTFLQMAFKKMSLDVKPKRRLHNFVFDKFTTTTSIPELERFEVIDGYIHSISQAFATLLTIYCQLKLTERSTFCSRVKDCKQISGSSQGVFGRYDFNWLTHFAGRAIDLAHSILNPNTKIQMEDSEHILQIKSSGPLDTHILQEVANRLGSCIVDASYGFIGVVLIKLMKSINSFLITNETSIAK